MHQACEALAELEGVALVEALLEVASDPVRHRDGPAHVEQRRVIDRSLDTLAEFGDRL